MLFGIIIGIISGGVIALIKGVKGKWDQDIKSEEMVGPGGHNNDDDSQDNS